MPSSLKTSNALDCMMNTSSQDIERILNCNAITETKGLSLSYAQVKSLLETRLQALKNNGRVEFGDPILPKIIYAFSDSVYLDSENYVPTLHDLIDIFYSFKNECKEMYSDDDLIDYLYTTYENYCHGSTTFLAHKGLEKLLHPEMEEDDSQNDILDTLLEDIDANECF